MVFSRTAQAGATSATFGDLRALDPDLVVWLDTVYFEEFWNLTQLNLWLPKALVFSATPRPEWPGSLEHTMYLSPRNFLGTGALYNVRISIESF